MSQEIAHKIDELQTRMKMLCSFEGSLHISLFNQDVFAISDFEWAFTLLEALSSELAESLKRLTDEAFEDMRRCNECKKLRNARFVAVMES